MDQPLGRDNVTVASRIMLPTYALLSLLVGLIYIFDPQGRAALAPALEFQREMLPLHVWGLGQLILAMMMIFALIVHRRIFFAYALCCMSLTWLLWGACFVISITRTPNTSYLAPLLPWFVSVACIASVASLIRKET